MTIAERYEWLIRITTLIRSQGEPQPREWFDILVRELGQILQFDALAMFDEAPNTVECHLGPGLPEQEKTSKEIEE